MLAIGLVVVALSILGIVWGIFQKVKAGRVTDAPLVGTGDVVQRGASAAGPKGQISAQGQVACAQPLISPVTGTPCLFYRIKCTAEWKQGDSHKSKVLDEQKAAAQFSIDDGTGPVWIDAREGGDFEPTTTKSETKGTGILGGITGTEIQFGNYKVHAGILTIGTKYRVEEEVMPLVPRVFACGRLAEQGNAITAPSWRQLILSSKSRDELLAHATKSAKIALIGGAVALAAGSGLSIVGQMMVTHDDDTKVAAVQPEVKSAPLPPASVTATPSASETAPMPVATAPAARPTASGKPGAKPKPSASAASSAAKPAASAKK